MCFFLCTDNSARSILAQSLLTHAGSFPKGQVHPMAIELLKRRLTLKAKLGDIGKKHDNLDRLVCLDVR
jgi:protein-tyrosine-phosphatase